MEAPLGVWGFIPSHFPTLPRVWNVTPELPSWPATLQTLALVASPRLGLRHYYCVAHIDSLVAKLRSLKYSCKILVEFLPCFYNYICWPNIQKILSPLSFKSPWNCSFLYYQWFSSFNNLFLNLLFPFILFYYFYCFLFHSFLRHKYQVLIWCHHMALRLVY
jgi:hypothetical protein